MQWVEGKARHLKREPWTEVLTGKKAFGPITKQFKKSTQKLEAKNTQRGGREAPAPWGARRRRCFFASNFWSDVWSIFWLIFGAFFVGPKAFLWGGSVGAAAPPGKYYYYPTGVYTRDDQ